MNDRRLYKCKQDSVESHITVYLYQCSINLIESYEKLYSHSKPYCRVCVCVTQMQQVKCWVCQSHWQGGDMQASRCVQGGDMQVSRCVLIDWVNNKYSDGWLTFEMQNMMHYSLLLKMFLTFFNSAKKTVYKCFKELLFNYINAHLPSAIGSRITPLLTCNRSRVSLNSDFLCFCTRKLFCFLYFAPPPLGSRSKFCTPWK